MKGQLKLSAEDKAWAKAVKERDGLRCVICGDPNRLNAHHIIARENHATKYDINNGLSLCPTHHFFNRQLSAHNNPLGLILWLMENRPEQFYYVVQKQRELLKEKDGLLG